MLQKILMQDFFNLYKFNLPKLIVKFVLKNFGNENFTFIIKSLNQIRDLSQITKLEPKFEVQNCHFDTCFPLKQEKCRKIEL